MSLRDNAWQVPEEERFRVPFRDYASGARRELFEPESRTDAALNAVLLLSILLATASVGYAIAVPSQGEKFTEFYLLTENETGELVADDYPKQFQQGESKPIIVGIGNNEHQQMTYTVLVEIQRVEIQGNETIVNERAPLRQFRPTVEHNETWQRQHQIQPTLTGEELRLQYRLYRGGDVATTNTSEPYRELHLWVNVTA